MKELPIRSCKECGEDFRQKRADQVFCSMACRHKYHRRAQVRGGRAVELLLQWRKTRGKKGLLTDLAAMVDGWIKEDRK